MCFFPEKIGKNVEKRPEFLDFRLFLSPAMERNKVSKADI